MQVALDAATFGVARLDDSLARRGQLVARARARDGKPDKLGERLQAALGLERKGFLRPQGDDEGAPGDAGDRDRHADAAGESERAQLGCARAGEVVVVRSRGRSGLQHLQRRSDLELVDVAELEGTGRLAELADDRRRSCVFEAVKHGCPEAEQPTDLLRHGLKDLIGRRISGDQGRHPAKRRLLGRQSLLLRLGAPLLREVAGDRNDLAVAARNDPCLSPVRHAADRRAHTRSPACFRSRARARCRRGLCERVRPGVRRGRFGR